MQVRVYANMELIDDDQDFLLTQEPVRDYSDTQSADYGSNVVEDDQVVSLEGNIEPNFDVDIDGLFETSQTDDTVCVQIDDISDPEEEVTT